MSQPDSGRFPPVSNKYQVSASASASPGSHRSKHLDAEDSILHEPNPFALPKEDVFLMREREKAMKQQERARLQQMKIWEKPSRTSELRLMSSTAPAGHISSTYQERVEDRHHYLNTTIGTGSASGGAQSGQAGLAARALNGAVGPAATLSFNQKDRMFQGRRREKENMADFIAKKRDMFLIQMSLDTKRQEIQKLEEKAQMKEDALRKSEMMLEEDAMRFDAFLKENDRKAHDALKRADLETKEKQEKVMEIKKLNAEINKIENEMSKYEEQLNACMKYKEFLDSLTPKEFLEDIRKQKEARRKRKQQLKQTSRDGTSLPPSTAGSQSSRAHSRHLASSHGSGDEVEDDEFDAAGHDSDEDADPMYFHKPDQLLDIFTQLEEQNLFLIQNVQETEGALEELNQKFQATKEDMKTKTDLLNKNIEDLKQKISEENTKADSLRKRAKANSAAGNQQKLLAGLAEKVREVYVNCGFDADTQTDTLEMLREIEDLLERLLSEITIMMEQDKSKVEAAEKKKNAERRNEIRQKKKEEQKRLYEERLAKSTARAKAEVIKQTGKQVMFRSPPLRKKKKKEDVEEVDEEAEELKRFFT